MKKAISIFLALVFVLLFMSACKAPAHVGDTESPDTAPESNTDSVIKALYDAVLAKDSTFLNVSEDKQATLTDSFNEFTFIDLDGDKIQECVVRSLEKAFILHCENGVVYGHEFSFREISEIDTNGNCYWNDMTEKGHEQGANRFSFSEDTYEIMPVYRIVNDGEENAEYYIGLNAVTKSEMSTFIDSLPKENVSWTKRS